MSTYKELLAQRAELDKKIEAERATARAQVLATVRELCAEHGITAADLAPGATKTKPRATATATVPAKYRDPATGQTWTGRGKEPAWIRGQDRSTFLITPAT